MIFSGKKSQQTPQPVQGIEIHQIIPAQSPTPAISQDWLTMGNDDTIPWAIQPRNAPPGNFSRLPLDFDNLGAFFAKKQNGWSLMLDKRLPNMIVGMENIPDNIGQALCATIIRQRMFKNRGENVSQEFQNFLKKKQLHARVMPDYLPALWYTQYNTDITSKTINAKGWDILFLRYANSKYKDPARQAWHPGTHVIMLMGQHSTSLIPCKSSQDPLDAIASYIAKRNNFSKVSTASIKIRLKKLLEKNSWLLQYTRGENTLTLTGPTYIDGSWPQNSSRFRFLAELLSLPGENTDWSQLMPTEYYQQNNVSLWHDLDPQDLARQEKINHVDIRHYTYFPVNDKNYTWLMSIAQKYLDQEKEQYPDETYPDDQQRMASLLAYWTYTWYASLTLQPLTMIPFPRTNQETIDYIDTNIQPDIQQAQASWQKESLDYYQNYVDNIFTSIQDNPNNISSHGRIPIPILQWRNRDTELYNRVKMIVKKCNTLAWINIAIPFDALSQSEREELRTLLGQKLHKEYGKVLPLDIANNEACQMLQEGDMYSIYLPDLFEVLNQFQQNIQPLYQQHIESSPYLSKLDKDIIEATSFSQADEIILEIIRLVETGNGKAGDLTYKRKLLKKFMEIFNSKKINSKGNYQLNPDYFKNTQMLLTAIKKATDLQTLQDLTDQHFDRGINRGKTSNHYIKLCKKLQKGILDQSLSEDQINEILEQLLFITYEDGEEIALASQLTKTIRAEYLPAKLFEASLAAQSIHQYKKQLLYRLSKHDIDTSQLTHEQYGMIDKLVVLMHNRGEPNVYRYLMLNFLIRTINAFDINPQDLSLPWLTAKTTKIPLLWKVNPKLLFDKNIYEANRQGLEDHVQAYCNNNPDDIQAQDLLEFIKNLKDKNISQTIEYITSSSIPTRLAMDGHNPLLIPTPDEIDKPNTNIQKEFSAYLKFTFESRIQQSNWLLLSWISGFLLLCLTIQNIWPQICKGVAIVKDKLS